MDYFFKSVYRRASHLNYYYDTLSNVLNLIVSKTVA